MIKLFTSESVTPGHPDKLCDKIADNILDEYLKFDPNSRVACEVCAHKNGVLVTGEITSKVTIDIEQVVRNTIVEIGYDNGSLHYNGNNINIEIDINKQSDDISIGVNSNDHTQIIGAGDQGMMFGYATSETENYMPYAIWVAHKLSEKLTELYRTKKINYLRPDGKCQITVKYENDKPVLIDTILISVQHDEIDLSILKNDIKKFVIDEIIPKNMIDEETKVLINPTGRFVIGGPVADSGLTGRKIIVDTYGGYAIHGGGDFSGKDASKVDRSAAYYARYVAKNVVAASICDKIEIQVSYAIGISKPISININTFGTNKISEEKILNIINKVFNFELNNIIEELDLKKPIYHLSTCFGHFGKDNLPWEKLDKVAIIKSLKD